MPPEFDYILTESWYIIHIYPVIFLIPFIPSPAISAKMMGAVLGQFRPFTHLAEFCLVLRADLQKVKSNFFTQLIKVSLIMNIAV